MRSVYGRLRSSPRRLLALSGVIASLVVAAAPVSGPRAAVFPGGVVQGGELSGPSGCVDANAPSGIGDAGATVNQICGVPLAVVGPSTGQVATQIGPTIVGSLVVAPVTVSSAAVAVSSLP